MFFSLSSGWSIGQPGSFPIFCSVFSQSTRVDRCLQLDFSVDRAVDHNLCLVPCCAWISCSTFLINPSLFKRTRSWVPIWIWLLGGYSFSWNYSLLKYTIISSFSKSILSLLFNYYSVLLIRFLHNLLLFCVRKFYHKIYALVLPTIFSHT